MQVRSDRPLSDFESIDKALYDLGHLSLMCQITMMIAGTRMLSPACVHTTDRPPLSKR